MTSNAPKVLLVTPGNIGDTVLCLPVLAFLGSEYAGSRVHVLTSPAASEVFRSDTRVTKLMCYDKRSGPGEKLSLVKALLRERYSHVVDLRNTVLPALLGFKFWGRFLTRQAKLVGDGRQITHKKDHYLEMAAVSLGKEKAGGGFMFGTNSADEEAARSLLGGCGIREADTVVAIAPGGRTKLKRYPPLQYAVICRYLKDAGVKVISVGDINDVAVEMEMAAHGADFAALAGKTSLAQLAAVFKRCALVIANDSAPMHVASAAGVPVAGLFGPTDPVKYGPVSPGSCAVRSGLECSPCGSADCGLEPGTACPPCMRNIRAEEVMGSSFDRLRTNVRGQ